jgi:hypothetical protein
LLAIVKTTLVEQLVVDRNSVDQNIIAPKKE